MPIRRLVMFLPLLGCADEPADTGLGTDVYVAFGVLDTLSFLYNQNVIGTPEGPKDISAACLKQGRSRLTGTSVDEGTLTDLDLTYQFQGCGTSGDNYDLVLDGEAVWAGTFRTTGYAAWSTTADGFTAAGEAGGEAVSDTCTLAVTVTGVDGGARTARGTWCGRDVEWGG